VLTCQDLVELVTDHLEGALGPVRERAVSSHLAGCAECRLYVEQMQETSRLLGALSRPGLPEGSHDVVVGAFRRRSTPRDGAVLSFRSGRSAPQPGSRRRPSR
jgi:anti-sigma factor RsiW